MRNPAGGRRTAFLRFDRVDHSLPQIWHPRFYDFNLWSQKKFVEKLRYMHLNPVERRLASHPKDWPWSISRSPRGRKTVWSALIPCVDPVHEDQVKTPSRQKEAVKKPSI